MTFGLHIRNFGKLSDEKIHVGRFTVLAGPNNTGKSTVSKLLYSVFDGVNANHASIYLNSIIELLRKPMYRLLSRIGKKGRDLPFIIKLEEILEDINSLTTVASYFEKEDFDVVLQTIKVNLSEFERYYSDSIDKLADLILEDARNDLFHDDSYIEKMTHDVTKNLEILKTQIDNLDYEIVVRNGIGQKICDNFVFNFQAQNFLPLKPIEGEDIVIAIDSIGSIHLLDTNSIEFDISEEGLNTLQEYSRVIYLESPIYWKLQSALENLRLAPRFRHFSGRRLDGVPGYFYDLASCMRETYSGEIAFPKLLDKLVAEDFMAGKIKISDKGQLTFQQGEREHSLHLTAMGVINVGILALLIERKILDKGAFLFIDEPEAHLHPAWQVHIADVLFDLARQGVNVVIATHSLNILKWLEVHIKHHPEDQELVALNRFTRNGVCNSQDFEEQISSIKEELSDPFSKLYIQGI